MIQTRHTLPGDIERTSMRIIESELAARHISLPPEASAVIRRVIHTTADFDYAENLRFTPGAVQAGVSALTAGAPVITDTNMALAGISKPSLAKLGGTAHCFMADPQISRQAREHGTTRAVAAMYHGAEHHPDGIFVVGNAPTALLALEELLEGGLRPSLIIGVPVGFVNVEESKVALWDSCTRHSVPAIVSFGRKGGSNVAAAICNALLYTAAGTLDPTDRGWQG